MTKTKIKRYLIRADTSIYATNEAEAKKVQMRIWKAIMKATDFKATPKRAIRYTNIKYRELKGMM